MNNDELHIPAEIQSSFEETARAAFELHKQELRRSLDMNAGFYDKLSALNAGSIAIAASVGVNILARSTPASVSLHAISRWLLAIILCLWLSLMCSVIHNFVLVIFGRLEVSYSEAEFIRTMIKRGLALAAEVPPHIGRTEMAELEAAAQEESLSKQRRNVARREWLRPLSSVLGYIAIASFLAAYTLVALCILLLVW